MQNGVAVAEQQVSADGKPHELKFTVNVKQSSWIALRQFPQLHTNPVNVILDGKPIRASRSSALWCAETIRLLWNNRKNHISEPERADAEIAYERAIATYVRIAGEAK